MKDLDSNLNEFCIQCKLLITVIIDLAFVIDIELIFIRYESEAIIGETFDFVVRTVPDDCMAPFTDRAYADPVMLFFDDY